MTKFSRKLIVLAGFAAVLLFGLQFGTAQQDGRVVRKWEYKVINLGGVYSQGMEEVSKQLNTKGDDGWEVIAMPVSGNDNWYVTLKRPKN